MEIKDLLDQIVKERPVGTANNEKILGLLTEEFLALGYKVISLPFECLVWQKGASLLKIGHEEVKIEASPYSKAFSGSGIPIVIHELEALQTMDLKDKIIILCGKATQNPIQPKDYPFYYPDENRKTILRLESQKPRAIIAMTGQSKLSGMNPFPMFVDGSFSIPSAYMCENKKLIETLESQTEEISLIIASQNLSVQSSQLISHKNSSQYKKKIILCAHMDTQYDTPGAFDNGTGVVTLIRIMQKLKDVDYGLDIDFVPFNTEEYFGANGEIGYLEYLDKRQEEIALVINIDSPCHVQSKTAISYYNIQKDQETIINETITQYERVEKGEAWYAGDHCMFAMKNIPCLAVSSSNLFKSALEHIHTPKDTLKDIDETLIEETAEFLVELVQRYRKLSSY